jgi:RPA family protein
MLEVKEEFDTLDPEEIEETENGARLIWKIEKMEPKESRILTYKIRSDLEVESEIILPGAELLEEEKKIDKSEEIKAEFPTKEST